MNLVPALVAEFAGHRVAGLPFFAPETVTSDHGSVYKSRHVVRAARRLGTDLLPARMMRPTDKAACERAFAGIQSLLLELLLQRPRSRCSSLPVPYTHRGRAAALFRQARRMYLPAACRVPPV
jgi:transposase InsO family protein